MSWDNIDFPGEFYDYEINKKNIEGKDLNYRMIYYLTMENQLLLINQRNKISKKRKVTIESLLIIPEQHIYFLVLFVE